MNKLNHVMNIVMGAFAGVFIGRSLYAWWDFKAHPGVYTAYSAPWYTSILLHGALTVIILCIALVVKFAAKKYGQRSKKKLTDGK